MPKGYLVILPLVFAGACAHRRVPAAGDVPRSLGCSLAYEQIFALIARSEIDGWEPNEREVIRFAADSTVRRHQPVGDYDQVISVEAQYYGDDDRSGIRGAHNGGSFYVFGRRGAQYTHLDTLSGDSIATGTFNGELFFTTRSHWSCAEYQRCRYEWRGRHFRLTEDRLLECGEDGEVVLKDFMRVKNGDVRGLVADLEKGDADVRRAAVNALCDIPGERALRAVIAALQDDSPLVRRSAADALRSRGGRTALPELLKAANDPDQGVRIGALLALSNTGDAGVLSVLTAALRNDGAKGVRCTAAIALRRAGGGGGGGGEACRALVAALKDADYEVRIAAAESLGALKNEACVPALIEVLGEDGNEYARHAAAGALAGFTGREVVDALVQALGDRSPAVRRNAAESLGRIGDRTALPAVRRLLEDEHESGRTGAIRAVAGLLGREAVPVLLEALGDGSYLVRGSAAALLGQVGDRSVLPALRALARDKESYVRTFAKCAISEIERKPAPK